MPRKDSSDVAPIISTIVQWVIVPLIMLAVFAFACVIACSARTPESKVSSWAGFCAGLVTFVVYVVSQLNQIREPDFHSSALPGLLLFPLGLGLAAGYAFLGLVRLAVPTRLVGLITLALAASSTSAMFTYIFIDTLRVSVLYWTLGATLGILLHIVLFPMSVEHIFKPGPGRVRAPADARLDPLPEFVSSSGPRSADAEESESARNDGVPADGRPDSSSRTRGTHRPGTATAFVGETVTGCSAPFPAADEHLPPGRNDGRQA
jgi:hypothetical protein